MLHIWCGTQWLFRLLGIRSEFHLQERMEEDPGFSTAYLNLHVGNSCSKWKSCLAITSTPGYLLLAARGHRKKPFLNMRKEILSWSFSLVFNEKINNLYYKSTLDSLFLVDWGQCHVLRKTEAEKSTGVDFWGHLSSYLGNPNSFLTFLLYFKGRTASVFSQAEYDIEDTSGWLTGC